MKITIGNSCRGYDQVDVLLISNKLKLNGEIYGNKSLIKKAIANYNKNIKTVVTKTGDELTLTLTTL